MAQYATPRRKAHSLFNEVWNCGRCGREFGDATAAARMSRSAAA